MAERDVGLRGSATGPLWMRMNRSPRKPIKSLRKNEIPEGSGIYALYENGEPVYVGKAKSLRNRIWKNHCGRGKAMTGSALRRNVASRLLKTVTAADIKAGRYQPTSAELERVRDYLETCEIAWWKTGSDQEAVDLEKAVKREWRPHFTKV
jgi:excinuclease UvrABC nuclease subunit